ncbi:MAG: hypothetical protein IJZ72_08280 [Oscillospiraceae bacterium]|nr:hypothetical protein [Oscillospiraceae bacterium]
MNIIKANIRHEDITIDEVSLSWITAGLTGDAEDCMLIPAWMPFNSDLQGEYEQRFLWEMLDNLKDGMKLPVLICPSDRDLRCTIIAAEIKLTEDTVIFDGLYNKTGRYSHTEFRNILFEDLSDDDFVDIYVNYGSSADDFEHWNTDHWTSHMKQRVYAYYSRFFADESNFTLLSSDRYVFDRKEFYKCVDEFRDNLK